MASITRSPIASVANTVGCAVSRVDHIASGHSNFFAVVDSDAVAAENIVDFKIVHVSVFAETSAWLEADDLEELGFIFEKLCWHERGEFQHALTAGVAFDVFAWQVVVTNDHWYTPPENLSLVYHVCRVRAFILRHDFPTAHSRAQRDRPLPRRGCRACRRRSCRAHHRLKPDAQRRRP